MVECAFVLMILLLTLLTMLDLGLAVLNYNTLSAAARRTARQAIVRGEHAAPLRTAWGVTEYAATADDETEQAAAVRAGLVAISPQDVDIRMEWPDGDNRVNDRVRVTLSHRYVPILPLPFLSEYYDLKAVSTMTIVH